MRKRNGLGASAALGCSIAAISSLATASVFSYNDAYTYYHDSSGYHLDTTLCAPTALTISGSCGVSGFSAALSSSVSPSGVVHAAAQTTLSSFDTALSSPQPSAYDSGTLSYASGVLYGSVSFLGEIPFTLVFLYTAIGQVHSVQADMTTSLNSGYAVYVATDQSGYETSQTINPTFGSSSLGVSQSGGFDVPVTGSAPVNFYIDFEAIDQLGSSTGQDLSGSVISDFSSTAAFGLEALDANGNDITRLARFEFSGVSLPEIPSVPEPGTWMLTFVGLLAIGIGLRNRRETSTTI